MRALIILVPAIALAACASTPSPRDATQPPRQATWVAEKRVDKFTDRETCRVVPRSYISETLSNRFSVSFFPFVSKVGDELRVGLFNTSDLPAGRVQLRIDQNNAWTVETSETPVDSEGQVSTTQLAAQMKSVMQSNPALQSNAALQKQLEQSAAASAQSINQAMSPFTAATGDKARNIVAQMKLGSSLIYRQLGSNTPGTTTGTIALDDDFIAAMAECEV